MSIHAEWLSLIEVSGAFLAEPVLHQAFPQGLEGIETAKKQAFRQTYEEWREALDTGDELQSKLHREWINWVLKVGLEWDEDDEGNELKSGSNVPADLKVELLGRKMTLKPDYALYADDVKKPYLLVSSYPANVELTDVVAGDGWSTTPLERMSQLCRATGTRLGLITNGEQWMIVDAPEGGITSYASWYARLWSQEPITLKAFFSLLNISTIFNGFGLEARKLTDLLDDSLKYQDEVTETLGAQVQRAVEVLVQSLDRINNDSNGDLLAGVEPPELYEAGLTYMMRLVFLLCAEERGLLLLGDETYEANYAVSTLRMKLREEAGLHGEEVLSYRNNAWARLLAVFRAVYGGVEHESMRMPALGGSLFDPDRFPFLEGRSKNSNWKIDQARPLPIDNRTVLLFLDAIQLYQGRTLSYRALDVEQIGYVYEGLLERTVIRSPDVTLELGATKSSKKPWLLLGELESAKMDGVAAANKLLKERTGSSASRIQNDLAKEVSEAESEKLLLACQNDALLRDRIKPYYHFLRIDAWENPLLYPKNAYMVAAGADRRETGSHYTPKSLTEYIVHETLIPIVYVGAAEGTPRDQWVLKSASEILDLKICDPAMGSGAFLVEACRWLSERLCEAWSHAESTGRFFGRDGEVVEGACVDELLPSDVEERTVIAKRLIAERCLYGVDQNPLAVELAKLSIWLVTLSKGRPFGFLDHNLSSGDSLLGIHQLTQLTEMKMVPDGTSQQQLFGRNIEDAVRDAIDLRKHLREMPIRDINDVEVMARLDSDARLKLEIPEQLADAFVAEVFASNGNGSALEQAVSALAVDAEQAVDGDEKVIRKIVRRTKECFSTGLPPSKSGRRPFHWPLVFPEVFAREKNGFDAIIGNPPFVGNRLWKTTMGDKAQWLCHMILGASPGKVDLCVVFHRRAAALLGRNGSYGLVATSNIAEGSAIGVGLGVIVQEGDIYFARKSMPWPGTAAVVVSIVGFFKGRWLADCEVNGRACDRIGPRLEPEAIDSWTPQALADCPFSFEGVNNSKGLAFVIKPDDPWFERLKREPDSLLRPYITGDDITSSALLNLKRWALDIADREIEDIEKNWPVAYRFLIEEVQATRTPEALKSYKGLYDRWWQFWNHRADLMRRLRKEEKFIAFAKATKYPFCILAPSDWIFTNKVLLIGAERPDMFSICLSSFFRIWLYKFSVGSLGADNNTLSLSIRESVAKFPLPNSAISSIGQNAANIFLDKVLVWSEDHSCGLTDTMNAINTPQIEDQIVCDLREAMVSIDAEIAAAYDWNDLDLSYDFVSFSGGSANDLWRWSLSEDTISEIMTRLTALNKEQYDVEKSSLQPIRGVAKSQKYEIATKSDSDLKKIAEEKSQTDMFRQE